MTTKVHIVNLGSGVIEVGTPNQIIHEKVFQQQSRDFYVYDQGLTIKEAEVEVTQTKN